LQKLAKSLQKLAQTCGVISIIYYNCSQSGRVAWWRDLLRHACHITCRKLSKCNFLWRICSTWPHCRI